MCATFERLHNVNYCVCCGVCVCVCVFADMLTEEEERSIAVIDS